jgi:hypothetical protein
MSQDIGSHDHSSSAAEPPRTGGCSSNGKCANCCRKAAPAPPAGLAVPAPEARLETVR